MPDIIKAAGGVVVSGDKILFIKKNGRWEFPKGRLKKGANRKKTAIREICEETGIKKKEISILKVRSNLFIKIRFRKGND